MAIEDLTKDLAVTNFNDRRAQLWDRKEPVEIREWIKLCMDTRSTVHQLYHVCRQDLDGDVGHAAGYIAKLRENPEHLFGLRRMWNFLMGNYAVTQARQVSAALKAAGEPWWWRIWRWKDVLMWRLAISILAGFLMLSSSSLLVEILACAQDSRAWLIALSALAVVALFLHVFTDMLRRVAKGRWQTIVGRTLIVTAFGIFYATFGGIVIYYGGHNLKMNPSSSLATLCAATGLLLGFVFYLFWQNRSIGDPV